LLFFVVLRVDAQQNMKKTKISKLKVKILRPNGKKESFWKVTTPKLGGGRVRRFFKEETDADTYIGQQEVQLGNYGVAGANLSETLRNKALAADEILSPLGLDLVTAAKHYAKFIKSTRGGLPLSDAVELLKKDRDTDDYSEEYKQSLKHRLKHFVEHFPDKTTTQITSSEIHTFLRGKKSIETRKSYRRNIKTLFQYLIKHHSHAIDPTPDLEKAKTVKCTKWRVAIITPEECTALLNAATPATLPSLALGMFCGLRASEIFRLDWRDVDIKEARIRISETVARKLGSKRTVPIPENCLAWITKHAKENGKVEPEDFHALFERVRVKAGFRPSNTREHRRMEAERIKTAPKSEALKPWPSNCLRHSAISYALAECGDESKVATWAGNSPKMIKQHYDAQATPSAAKTFFAIMPPKRGKSKIVPFSTKAA
jgi:integrase